MNIDVRVEKSAGSSRVVEKRIPWVSSFAWRSILSRVPIGEHLSEEFGRALGYQAAEILPSEIVEAVRRFKDDAYQSVFILRNCPIDESLPPTPYRGMLSCSQVSVSCQVMLALYHLMGIKPVVYEGENDGALFRHVVPTRSSRHEKSSHGAYNRFGYHVDNPDLPLSCEAIESLSGCPEYLSLFGLRCDPSVHTTVVPVEGLLQGMDAEMLEVLASPRFVIRRPASFGHPKETGSLPLIVRGAQGQWLCRFDTENTHASDGQSQHALEALKCRLATRQFDMPLLLLPGDFLIFKNQQVLHARDAFMPLDDGADRWLLRLFGMNDLSRTIPSSTGRPFEVAA